MTKLYISLPGQSSYRIYEENPQGKDHFTFVSFDGLRQIEIPVLETSEESFEANYLSDSEIPPSPGQDDYEELIAKTIREIRANQLGKIVISRPQMLSLEIDPPKVFRKLASAYPEACVYLFAHPAVGTWMGATPETLIKKDGKKLSTMSLAGTRKKGEQQSFTTKEKTEQQLVTDYIVRLLEKEKGVKNVSVSEPRVSEAGNLVHFKSEISAETTRYFLPGSLIEKLHPTPAVGGFPREESLAFVQENEDYDRAFYSGYFGLNNGEDFHYFVNLRCMRVFRTSLVLYAGGGITKDSDPRAEWEETASKMRTLLNVMEKPMD